MLTVEQQIEEIQKAIKKHIREKLVFEPQVWKPLRETRNCFTYALNIKSGIIEKELVGVFGKLVGLHPKNNIYLNEIYAILFDTLKVCGISFRKSYFEERVPYGWHKVAIYLSTEDIHWLRQDDDGSWSHKLGWYALPTNLDENGMPIVNPSRAKLNVSGDLIDIKYLLISRNLPE